LDKVTAMSFIGGPVFFGTQCRACYSVQYRHPVPTTNAITVTLPTTGREVIIIVTLLCSEIMAV